MSNSRLIDANDDDRWSRAEAIHMDKTWETKYGKESVLFQVYSTFENMAKSGHLDAQKQHLKKLAADKRKDQLQEWEAAKFPDLPFSWIKAEQHKLDLCIAFKPEICGNLELRGILEIKLGQLASDGGRFSTVSDRVGECKSILQSYCPNVFGELYQIYKDWGDELCGARSSHWHHSRVIYTKYAQADRYGPNHRSITSKAYQSFLFLIIFIWFVSMLGEIRKLYTWWVVLLTIPTTEEGVSHLSFEGENGDDIIVSSVPLKLKVYIIVVNLLFRTYIAVNLPNVGARFLLGADDFTNLILNSVALAFLIEIDEMLFAATAS
jgi:hypothetical protein